MVDFFSSPTLLKCAWFQALQVFAAQPPHLLLVVGKVLLLLLTGRRWSPTPLIHLLSSEVSGQENLTFLLS